MAVGDQVEGGESVHDYALRFFLEYIVRHAIVVVIRVSRVRRVVIVIIRVRKIVNTIAVSINDGT